MEKNNQLILKKVLVVIIMVIVLFLLDYISLNSNEFSNTEMLILLLYITNIFFIISILQVLFQITKSLIFPESIDFDNKSLLNPIENQSLNEKELKLIKSSSYLDGLISQYIYRKNLYLIQLFAFFTIGIVFIGAFFSKTVQFSLNTFITYFEYVIFILLIGYTTFMPFLLFRKKLFINKYKDLINSFNSENISFLTANIEKFYNQQSLKSNPDTDETLLDFFKAISLMYNGDFDQTIKLLSNRRFFLSHAFKYEYQNLLAECYEKIGENDNAKKFYLEALSGFKKIKFNKPISLIEGRLSKL